MKALLDTIAAVPPITIGQFLVIVAPLLITQAVMLAMLFKTESFCRRFLPSERSKGGPDG